MSSLQRVAVFCGSADGVDPGLPRAAYDVGAGLARRGFGLVYGGGGKGLMGSVAQGALDAGGEVIGVIPQAMVDREWGRDDLTELHVVGTMHERKALMAEYADAFLCLPGGLGTLEEIFEVWSWRQIAFHDDPVGFLDLGGFWEPLLAALRGLVDAGFVSAAVMDDLVVASTLDEALEGLAGRIGVRLPAKVPGGNQV
ncbi:MAG TPA: TIGR00730 family Rossman fold protein [Marmoricola sp.]|nr:TIGR00730 family Rossman fold protein [Marmoricola sp.]